MEQYTNFNTNLRYLKELRRHYEKNFVLGIHLQAEKVLSCVE